MRTPGLIADGSRTHRIRFARVFASVPAAIDARLLKCDRPGPTVPRASVPAMLWQSAHPVLMNTALPYRSVESVGGSCGADAAASHAANLTGGSAMMYSAICAC